MMFLMVSHFIIFHELTHVYQIDQANGTISEVCLMTVENVNTSKPLKDNLLEASIAGHVTWVPQECEFKRGYDWELVANTIGFIAAMSVFGIYYIACLH